ncbi:MAG: hypothetical protein HY537_08165 [Deltaproteobacteria bacterium]|nr:hypothetical protein [Deltaproteobacteria bacterium]
MGKLTLNPDRNSGYVWTIDGTEIIKPGEWLEIRSQNGLWERIRVGKDAQGIYHPEPTGVPFHEGIEVRRPTITQGTLHK